MSKVEGPERYCARDVANVFAQALSRPVELVVTPREKWGEAYRAQGFSQAAAQSYAHMMGVSVDTGFEAPTSAERS